MVKAMDQSAPKRSHTAHQATVTSFPSGTSTPITSAKGFGVYVPRPPRTITRIGTNDEIELLTPPTRQNKRLASHAFQFEDVVQDMAQGPKPKLPRITVGPSKPTHHNVGQMRRDDPNKERIHSSSDSVLSVLSATPSPQKLEQQRQVVPANIPNSSFVRSSQEDENTEEDDSEFNVDLSKQYADMRESDSESELDDLADLLDIKAEKRGHEKVLVTQNTSSRGLRSSARLSRIRDAQSLADAYPSAIIPSYKYSLDKLIKQNEADSRARAEINRAKDAMTLTGNDRSESDVSEEWDVQADAQVDESTFSAVIPAGAGADDQQRIMRAMARIDALCSIKQWSFFHHRPSHFVEEKQMVEPKIDDLPLGCDCVQPLDEAFPDLGV